MSKEQELLTGKVILVTGAGRGIGQAMATVFAQNGAVVYANDVRLGAVEAWCEEVNAAGPGQVRPLYFDICSEQEAKAAVMQVKKEHGHIDGLVNNAGVEFNELIGMISRTNMENIAGTQRRLMHKIGFLLAAKARTIVISRTTIDSIIVLTDITGDGYHFI